MMANAVRENRLIAKRVAERMTGRKFSFISHKGRLIKPGQRSAFPLEEVGGSGPIISWWDFEVAGAIERGHEIA